MKTTFAHYKKLSDFCTRHGFFEKKSTIILGLSGGPDSLFLLHFLAELHHEGSISLVAAHLDHQWRTESYQDVALCHRACQQLSIPLVSQQICELAFHPKDTGSKEDKARQQRRFFLETVRNTYNADYIALGHHADDQEETFFIRLLRGASLSGLVGMRPHAGIFIRPLLCLRKQEIVAYLDEQKIAYSVDATNNSNDFLRNRLRNSVLPALNQADSRFSTTFSTTLDHLQATEAFLETYASQQYRLLVEQQDVHYVINAQQYAQLDPVIQHRVIICWLRDYQVKFPVHANFFKQIMQFLSQKHGGSHQICHDWTIIKKNNRAHILKK